MNYRVVADRKAETRKPVKVFRGDIITPIEESNPAGDWPNWIYCNTGKNSGWIPKQIIDKNGIMLEDYNAHEFDVVIGDIIQGEKNLNGWVWGVKNSDKSIQGWVPLNCLELLR